MGGPLSLSILKFNDKTPPKVAVKAENSDIPGDRSLERQLSFAMDVTYVTEKIIVVTFPEGGLDTTYRSNLKEVTRMLRTKHGNKYTVFNLSEKRHDLARLNSQRNKGIGRDQETPDAADSLLFLIAPSASPHALSKLLACFNAQIVEFGWPAHLSPPLERLCAICKSLDSWFHADSQNVAILHSKASAASFQPKLFA
ncbi:hypothetical protein HPB50_016557 [Hyalomma asiaticum]|uniref:Uncharacterized protein n=1 Tax=Hyalomma asiaticum TaxID=266040 RepID=A0ACB7SWJ6_HYAAI|nr:hypothetical protein HPB50_016557 [Hyalomma asiaticum]